MFTYNRFLVREDDHFNAGDFPQIEEELSSIAVEIPGGADSDKAEMFVSFLKSNSIKKEDELSNPEFAEMLRLKTLPTSTLEELFKSCGHNQFFNNELEEHIKSRLQQQR